MPRQKTPPTLRRIGLEKLAYLIRKFQIEAVDDTIEEEVKPIYCNSYFTNCPGTIVEDLIDLLHWQQPSGIHCLQLELLLNCSLRRLWLHYSDSGNLKTLFVGFQRILRRLATCGEQIVDLSLKGCILWDSEELVRMLHGFQNLRRLVLCSCKLNDSVLEAVGNFCPNLEELQVSAWNSNITDNGMKSLIIKPLPLKTLIVDTDRYFSSEITRDCVVLLLQNLPQLEILKIPYLTEALVHLYNLSPELTLNLHLYRDDLGGTPLLQEHMNAIIHCCPHLNEIWMDVTNIETLLLVRELTRVSSLVVTWFLPDILSSYLFKNGLLPVIESIGNRITHLEISLDEIDVCILDKYCPLLAEFECTRFIRMRRSIKDWRKPFPYLKNLKLFPEEDNFITRDDWIYLLSGCHNLQTLFIGWCDSWNDQTIQYVLKKNPLVHLREIEMSDICSITTNGLNLLLLSESDLHIISILCCDLITLDEVNVLRNLIKALNLDVQIKYYE